MLINKNIYSSYFNKSRTTSKDISFKSAYIPPPLGVLVAAAAVEENKQRSQGLITPRDDMIRITSAFLVIGASMFFLFRQMFK